MSTENNRRIETALQQTGDLDKRQLMKEHDMLGRDSDRLRKDWVEMRDRADAAETLARALGEQLEGARSRIRRMSQGLPALRQALDELPSTCRYHDVRFTQERSVWGREACCDTGVSALRRHLANQVLEALEVEVSNDR